LHQPGSRIEIAEIPDPVVPPEMPVIRWVGTDDVAWKQGEPSFTITDGTSVKARGWVAITNGSILMKVTVTDKTHINDREKGNIWDGDCLQIGIDGEGEGAGSQVPETRMVGTHNGVFTAALTRRGPEIWVHYLGKNGPGSVTDGSRHYPCSIIRDEALKTTTYEIAFPWGEFSTLPGLSAFVGLCVQVNDVEDGRQLRYSWGHGVSGQPRPGLFVRMAVGKSPTEDEVAIGETTTRLWTPASSGELKVAVAKDSDFEISASMNGIEKKLRIRKPMSKAGIRRFKVQGTPGSLPVSPVTFSVRLTDMSGALLAERKAELTASGTVVGKLHEKIDALVAGSPHPLFTSHLRSLDAIVQAEWNRALFLVDSSPNVAEVLVSDCQTILDSLAAEGGDWNTYLRGEKRLILARSASHDSTLQVFLLTLPRNWDATKTYPLIVDLHGAGPENPLAYPVMAMKLRKGEAQWENNSQQCFRLTPWGRGNNGYREWGEDDVFEALDVVRREFKTDKDRTYLTGHSMGGGGAWGIGLRTPDLWAAVCPVSGGTWLTPLGVGLGGNASYVPFRIRHGDADGVVNVKNAYDMQTELRAGGNEPDLIIVPGQGHEYPESARMDDTQWLLEHTRKRPDHFTFMADTFRDKDRGCGAWGVLMDRAPVISGLPRFDCSIKGAEVSITSYGTKGLTVRLAEDGLGLKGAVKVWWNGRKAYEGPTKEIRLGEVEE